MIAVITNADVTVYRRVYNPQTRLDSWEREYVLAAWWFKSEQSSVDADGMHRADTVTIRIPDISVKVAKEDIIVKGKCEIDITTPKDLYGWEYCKVMSANYNDFGGTPHIRIGGQ